MPGRRPSRWTSPTASAPRRSSQPPQGFIPGARRYTSLVPTQVIRLLDHPGGADALRTFDAVLVGGAAMPPRLRARAERARVHLVATYGMSETAGGCVYDGRALPRTEVELDEEARILLGGPTIAHGYLGLPDLTRRRSEPTRTASGGSVPTTSATSTTTARCTSTAASTTSSSPVASRSPRGWWRRRSSSTCPASGRSSSSAAPTTSGGPACPLSSCSSPDAVHDVTAADLRAHLRGILPDHALPRRALTSPAIPTRGPGKPDRRAVEAMFTVG
jgi:O-succinylbenzoic acid--CoA ligase